MVSWLDLEHNKRNLTRNAMYELNTSRMDVIILSKTILSRPQDRIWQFFISSTAHTKVGASVASKPQIETADRDCAYMHPRWSQQKQRLYSIVHQNKKICRRVSVAPYAISTLYQLPTANPNSLACNN